MEQPKTGEIVTDGRSAAIGAPAIRAFVKTAQAAPPPPMPSQALAGILRHLKGIVAAGEELQRALEQMEKK